MLVQWITAIVVKVKKTRIQNQPIRVNTSANAVYVK
jgi:hypothetical protein